VAVNWCVVGCSVAVDKDDGPGDDAGLDGGGEFLRAAALVFGQKVEGTAIESSLQFVSPEVAGELISLLAELHRKADGRAVEVGSGGTIVR